MPHLKDAALFEVEVSPEGILLHPVVVVRRDDAWAYSTEHRLLVARAQGEVAAGQARPLAEADQRALAPVADEPELST